MSPSTSPRTIRGIGGGGPDIEAPTRDVHEAPVYTGLRGTPLPQPRRPVYTGAKEQRPWGSEHGPISAAAEHRSVVVSEAARPLLSPVLPLTPGPSPPSTGERGGRLNSIPSRTTAPDPTADAHPSPSGAALAGAGTARGATPPGSGASRYTCRG